VPRHRRRQHPVPRYDLSPSVETAPPRRRSPLRPRPRPPRGCPFLMRQPASLLPIWTFKIRCLMSPRQTGPMPSTGAAAAPVHCLRSVAICSRQSAAEEAAPPRRLLGSLPPPPHPSLLFDSFPSDRVMSEDTCDVGSGSISSLIWQPPPPLLLGKAPPKQTCLFRPTHRWPSPIFPRGSFSLPT